MRYLSQAEKEAALLALTFTLCYHRSKQQVPQRLFRFSFRLMKFPNMCAPTPPHPPTVGGLANSDKSSGLRHKVQPPSDSFFSLWIFSTFWAFQREMIGKSFPRKPHSLYFFFFLKRVRIKLLHFEAVWQKKEEEKKSSDLPLLIFLGLPNNSGSEFHFVSRCLQWPICAAQLSVPVFLYLSTSVSNKPNNLFFFFFCTTSHGYCCPIMTCLNWVVFSHLLYIIWAFVKFSSRAQ